MSARSDGCIFASFSCSIFSRTRRDGSRSIRSTKSHGIALVPNREETRSTVPTDSPFSSRRIAPRVPTSTSAMRNFSPCPSSGPSAPPAIVSEAAAASASTTGSHTRSTSFTRTTLCPCTSMICWSRRSRSSSRNDSSFGIGVGAASPRILSPPSAVSSRSQTATIDIRFPRPEPTSRNTSRCTWFASSGGDTANSRTCPIVRPLASVTGAPISAETLVVWLACFVIGTRLPGPLAQTPTRILPHPAVQQPPCIRFAPNLHAPTLRDIRPGPANNPHPRSHPRVPP